MMRFYIEREMEDAMKLRFLVAPLAALSCLAVPAMAQGYNAYSYDGPVITGAQMTDMPSQRANVTTSGSFLRPEVSGSETDIHVYRERHPYHAYREWNDRYDYGR
jgi:hypothetical protein